MTGFHIHVDAIELATEFERFLADEMGFWRSDFEGHPPDAEGFEPPHHLTLKVADSARFRQAFERVVGVAKERDSMKGYIEGEFVAFDENIPWKPFDSSVELPWTVQLGTLQPGQFRESELHITMERSRSSPELVSALRRMGLFSAYLRKPFGSAEVFTAQGLRKDIEQMAPTLRRFLQEAGGAADCSVMEERIAAWWTSASDIRLPPIVKRINRTD